MSNRRRLRQSGVAETQQRAMPDRPNVINVYVCDKCGGKTVTIDRHRGVTPMFLGCRADGTENGCGGRAASMGYPKGPPPPWAVPAWEWYQPDAIELRRMSPELRDHVQRGGLALRKISQATP